MSQPSELQPSIHPNSLSPSKVVVLRTRRGPEIANLTDVRREMSRIYRQCRCGKIRPEDGTRYTYILSQIGKVLEASEVEARVKALERALGRRRP